MNNTKTCNKCKFTLENLENVRHIMKHYAIL